MKKLFFTFLFAAITFSANAQFNFGGQFSINFANEHTDYSNGATDDKEYAYMINLKTKMYWNLNERMQVGGRIGFAFGRLTTGVIYESEKEEERDIVNRAIGWSLSPFYGFKVLNWKIVSVWASSPWDGMVQGLTIRTESSQQATGICTREVFPASCRAFQITA